MSESLRQGFALLIAIALLSGCQLQQPESPDDQLATPVSSPADPRIYRTLTLANGLKVLAIEDAESDLSAASLAVSVGSYDNPPERPGLAHFLEHMLFLGTRKFPDPNNFGAYMAKHGGRNNAYTAKDHTNYSFEIQPGAFKGALARFGQFFTAPLFSADYVDKERNAVHSEYQLQLKDDLWRMQSARRKAFNQDHPASRGNIGSLETLSDEQGDVRDDLIAFYNRHYKASRMMLVLIGPQGVERQLAWARRFFGGIAATPSVPDKVSAPLFAPKGLPALMAMKPEKDLRYLLFDFPLPAVQQHYRTKPAGHIAHFLGHEGEGSLYALLKQRGWIESLVAYGGAWWRQDGMVSVRIGLTEAGAANWREIGDALFAYLRLMRQDALEQWRFAEESLLWGLAFRFQSRTQPFLYVRELAANGLYYPLVDIIRAPVLLDVFNPDLVSQYLARLNPDRVLVRRVDPDAETNAVETWFQVPYQLSPLPDSLRERWQKSRAPDGLFMPKENIFIPENFSLLPDKPDIQTSWPPRLIINDRAWVWHLPDTSFDIPKAQLRFRLRSLAPDNPLNARNQAILSLYLLMVKDQLATYVYPANLAGLDYSLSASGNEVILSLHGYVDRQDALLSRVARTFAMLDIDEARFKDRKQQLIRQWRNSLKNRPYIRNLTAISDALVLSDFRAEDLAAQLATVSRQDVLRWRDQWLTEVGIAGLLYGNLDEEKARLLTYVLTNALPNTRPLPAPSNTRLAGLQAGSFLHNAKSDHPDAALVLYVQGRDQSLQERAAFTLLSQMLRNQYFDYLRTERQLGYVVTVLNKTWVNVPGLVFIAQSPTASASDILAATLNFADGYQGQLRNMSLEVFEGYKTATIHRLLEKDKNGSERAGRLWRELQAGETDFDSRRRLAGAVFSLDRASVRDFYQTFLARLYENSLVSYSTGKLGADLTTAHPFLKPLDNFYSLKVPGNLFKFSAQPKSEQAPSDTGL